MWFQVTLGKPLEKTLEKQFCFCPMRQVRGTNRSSSALILNLVPARVIYSWWMMIWVNTISHWMMKILGFRRKIYTSALSRTLSPLVSEGGQTATSGDTATRMVLCKVTGVEGKVKRGREKLIFGILILPTSSVFLNMHVCFTYNYIL